jgi:hypothetical protein
LVKAYVDQTRKDLTDVDDNLQVQINLKENSINKQTTLPETPALIDPQFFPTSLAVRNFVEGWVAKQVQPKIDKSSMRTFPDDGLRWIVNRVAVTASTASTLTVTANASNADDGATRDFVVTIPQASQVLAGLMSAADKKKLDTTIPPPPTSPGQYALEVTVDVSGQASYKWEPKVITLG